MNLLSQRMIEDELKRYFQEDDLSRNATYSLSLPDQPIKCFLKIKSEMRLAGLPFFIEAFKYFDKNFNGNDLLSHEGKDFKPGFVIEFSAPFSVALQVERTALNLLRRASAIATTTHMLSSKAKKIKILDTRKTTPGLRWLEKYAVRVGGGFNHRLGQVDSFMIKDNHKSFFGGLKPAFDFFQSQGSFYQGIIAEIHDLQEFDEAMKLGVRHVMLDNFPIEDIKKAVKLKSHFMTIELSGGINLDNIENYLIEGVDAISSGSITEWPKPVDISLKMKT